jgi:hypothetical protein
LGKKKKFTPANWPKNEISDFLLTLEKWQKSWFGKTEPMGPKINQQRLQKHFSQP